MVTAVRTIAGAPMAAHATPVIDQQQIKLNATSGFLTNLVDVAQTFTVGVSEQLIGITIHGTGVDVMTASPASVLDTRMPDVILPVGRLWFAEPTGHYAMAGASRWYQRGASALAV